MNPSLAIIESIFLKAFLDKKSSLTAESKLKVALLFFSAFMVVLSIGFGLFAAYLWLSANFSPAVTMASMGAISLTLASIGFLTIYLIFRYKAIKMKKMKDEIINVANTALEIADHELTAPIRENPKTSVLISSAAGLIAGNRFL